MSLSKEQKELVIEWLTGEDAAQFVLTRLISLNAAKKSPSTTKAVREFVYGLREQLEEVTLD